MAEIIALNKHFSGVSLVYAGPYSTDSFDAPLDAVCITPLPTHSDFQPLNIARTLGTGYRHFSISLQALKAPPSWSTGPDRQYLSMHLAFGTPVEPRKLLRDLALCIEHEHLLKSVPYTPSRIIITCRQARLALPAPAIAS